jgi:hypothetical protein
MGEWEKGKKILRRELKGTLSENFTLVALNKVLFGVII